MQNSCLYSRVFFAAFVLNFIIALSDQQVNTNICVDCSPYVTGKCTKAKNLIAVKEDRDGKISVLNEDEVADPAMEKCVPPGEKIDVILAKSLCIGDSKFGCTLAVNRTYVKNMAMVKKECEWCYTECGCKKLIKPPTKKPKTTKKSNKNEKNSAAIKSVVLASCMALTYISLALYDVINKIV